MAAIFEQYTDEMHREFGYLATWLPNMRLSLADVGMVKRDRFDRVTSLAELGVTFSEREAGTAGDLEYASAGQVDVSWNTQAEGSQIALAEASATVTVSFHRAHATLFQAAGCRVKAIADLVALQAALRQLAIQGRWQPNYVVLTEIVEAGPATVLVSSQGGARINFRAKAAGPVSPLALADASAELSMVSVSGIGIRIVAAAGLTPLFRASGLRSRFRRAPELVYRGGQAEAPEDMPIAEAYRDAELVALSYADMAVP